MSEQSVDGMTERQLLGIEYTQYTEDLPMDFSEKRAVESFSVEISGKAKQPPEIEKLALDEYGTQAYVIYYDLDKFSIVSKESEKKLDLVTISPDGWTQKIICITSPEYQPPEVHSLLASYQAVDVKRQECVINGNLGPEEDTSDMVVLICLWNTLIARFVEEIGDPVSPEGGNLMRESVLKRRSEVLEALKSKDDSDPQKVALGPFKNND
jgi:hypothetical protein